MTTDERSEPGHDSLSDATQSKKVSLRTTWRRSRTCRRPGPTRYGSRPGCPHAAGPISGAVTWRRATPTAWLDTEARSR